VWIWEEAYGNAGTVGLGKRVALHLSPLDRNVKLFFKGTMDCPNCSSTNAKRCEILYAQGSSVSYGPDYSTQNITGMASRVSPPVPPVHPSYFKRRLILLGLPGLLFCLLAIGLFSMLLANRGFPAALAGLIPGILGGYLLWQAWPPEGGLSSENYRQRSMHYAENLRLYDKLWACLDCGHIFSPDSKQTTV